MAGIPTGYFFLYGGSVVFGIFVCLLVLRVVLSPSKKSLSPNEKHETKLYMMEELHHNFDEFLERIKPYRLNVIGKFGVELKTKKKRDNFYKARDDLEYAEDAYKSGADSRKERYLEHYHHMISDSNID